MLKNNLLKQIFREILSYSTYLNIIPKPSFRKDGISAIVRVYNEREYIEASLNSIKDFVNEIIVVDTGSNDDSIDILNELSHKISHLKVFNYYNRNLWEFSNFALSKTSYKWILKWDADFIAIEENENWFSEFKKWLYKLDNNRYYYINPTLIELMGDFHHQFYNVKFRKDIEIFTYSEEIKYVSIERWIENPIKIENCNKKLHVKMEAVKIPKFYKILEYNRPIGFHLNIKSAERHLEGYFYLQWLAEKENTKEDIYSYMIRKIKEEWNISDIKLAAKFYMNYLIKNLEPYNGNLPKTIIKLSEKSPYKIIYRDGKIISRTDILF